MTQHVLSPIESGKAPNRPVVSPITGDIYFLDGRGSVVVQDADLPWFLAQGFVEVTATGGSARTYLDLKLDFGAKGDGVADDTLAVQAFINAVSLPYSNELITNNPPPLGQIPSGVYRLTSTITLPHAAICLRGAGQFNSIFECSGVAGSVFKTAAGMAYFNPTFCDFSIIDRAQSTTGIGIDATSVANLMYSFEFRNMYIQTKGACIAAYCFSGKFDNVNGNSSADHTFLVVCGPAVVWLGCYAGFCGPNKAGYRLTGAICMYSCNGINQGDYWGVFGTNTTATDGFQHDFDAFIAAGGGGTSYPHVTLINCNVEEFNKWGLYFCQQTTFVEVIGGDINRDALSTDYGGLIFVFGQQVLGSSIIRLGFGSILPGSGHPKGPTGAVATNDAWVYAAGPNTFIEDRSGAFVAAPITGFYSAALGGVVPFLTSLALSDVFEEIAYAPSAVSPRRLSIQTNRYASDPATGSVPVRTPVGTNQAIVVTGYSKVTVTPAAAASISTATFDTSNFMVDYQRNGDLYIQAGNANLTIVHSASGTFSFRMISGANVTMASGAVLHFIWSDISSQWIQV